MTCLKTSAVVRRSWWHLESSQLLSCTTISAQNAQQDPDRQKIAPDQLAEILVEEYGTPVTYEDPLWLWHGGMRPWGHERFAPIRPAFFLPDELDRVGSGKLDINAVQRALFVLNSQNPNAPHYRVFASKLGLNIVPFESHDTSGNLKAGGSILDARITVPRQSRTATEHLELLCAEVTKATGMPLKENGNDFDRNFAANGYVLPSERTGREKAYMVFEWGATGVSARDALIDLLDRSCTTMTWRLMCGADTPPSDRFCVLNMLPLNIRTESPPRTTLFFDRCTERKQISSN
jgi:hypothetical protein